LISILSGIFEFNITKMLEFIKKDALYYYKQNGLKVEGLGKGTISGKVTDAIRLLKDKFS